MSPIDEAVRAHIYAKRTLDAGFTTVRNVGAGEFIDVALRNAINEGAIPGPRMLVSTMPLSATGGHGDVNGMSPYLRFDSFSGIANGVDQIREKIRFEVKYGADLIKVLASAGVLSEEESVGAPQYSQEELNAIVEEAAMWGRKVAAHAHGAVGHDAAAGDPGGHRQRRGSARLARSGRCARAGQVCRRDRCDGRPVAGRDRARARRVRDEGRPDRQGQSDGRREGRALTSRFGLLRCRHSAIL